MSLILILSTLFLSLASGLMFKRKIKAASFTEKENFVLVLVRKGLTMCADADVTSGMVHASSFPPLFGYRIETAHSIEVLVTIESADHVDEIVQGA